jgi:predicted type IV restriction endonuclease
MKIPSKVLSQLTDNLKGTQAIIRRLRDADKNETDTVAVIRETLVTLFGYDQFEELVAELKIENLRCDLALKLDGQIWALVECKAVGVELRQTHIEQALHYAAKSGNHWVILTNAQRWQVWWVNLEGRISSELILDVDLLALSAKSERDVDQLYALSRYGMFSGMLGAVRSQKNALDRFWLAQVLQSGPVLASIRREIARLEQNKVTDNDIQRSLTTELLKRELIDDPRAEGAKLRYKRALRSATTKEAARRALNAAKTALDNTDQLQADAQ